MDYLYYVERLYPDAMPNKIVRLRQGGVFEVFAFGTWLQERDVKPPTYEERMRLGQLTPVPERPWDTCGQDALHHMAMHAPAFPIEVLQNISGTGDYELHAKLCGAVSLSLGRRTWYLIHSGDIHYTTQKDIFSVAGLATRYSSDAGAAAKYLASDLGVLAGRGEELILGLAELSRLGLKQAAINELQRRDREVAALGFVKRSRLAELQARGSDLNGDEFAEKMRLRRELA